MERATHRAASEGRQHAAAMGLILLSYWAEQDGLSVAQGFLNEHPDLRSNKVVIEMIESLTRYGRIEL